MDSTHIGLLDLAERRMAWVDQRQSVLAQNIANANTPGYQPHDLRPFAETLAGATGVTLARTQPDHLAETTGGRSPAETVDRQNPRSLDGNTVSLDEQLMKLADADSMNQLVTTIYKKYLGMFATALDRGSSG